MSEIRKRHRFSRPSDQSPVDYFWSFVDKAGDCWEWLGSRDTKYATKIKVNDLRDRPHRIAYILTKGAIPDGMQIDHICRNMLCVNPGHLRTVTPKQNSENKGTASVQGSSAYRGVSRTSEGKWRARVTHAGREHTRQPFETAELAMAAAIALRAELFTHSDEQEVGVMGKFDQMIRDGQTALNHEHVNPTFADILTKHLAAMTAHDQEEEEE